MNDILLGAGVCLFFVIYTFFMVYGGYIMGSKSKPDIPKPTEEEQRRLKQIQDGWQNILNYDLNVAMKRGG